MTVARSVPMNPSYGLRLGRDPFDAAALTRWYPGGAGDLLVSTQLARAPALDPGGVRMLRSMQAVLVGVARSRLRRRCKNLRIPAIATYGTTESSVAAWRRIAVAQRGRGILDDQIASRARNLAAGYVPGPALPRPWPTGDMGHWRDWPPHRGRGPPRRSGAREGSTTRLRDYRRRP